MPHGAIFQVLRRYYFLPWVQAKAEAPHLLPSGLLSLGATLKVQPGHQVKLLYSGHHKLQWKLRLIIMKIGIKGGQLFPMYSYWRKKKNLDKWKQDFFYEYIFLILQNKGNESENSTKNWRDHCGQADKNTRKQNWNISTDKAIWWHLSKTLSDAIPYIRSLLIEKDGRVRQNISILFPCVFVCLSYSDLFNFW